MYYFFCIFSVVEEAREVFGVDEFNIDEFYEEDEDAEIEGEDEEEEEEEEIDEITGEVRESESRRRKKSRPKKETLMDTMEPSEVEKGFVTNQDKRILFEDKPERFQVGLCS